jgi:predicted  nucleic acid-binding Zn-ribbon protein
LTEDISELRREKAALNEAIGSLKADKTSMELEVARCKADRERVRGEVERERGEKERVRREKDSAMETFQDSNRRSGEENADLKRQLQESRQKVEAYVQKCQVIYKTFDLILHRKAE